MHSQMTTWPLRWVEVCGTCEVSLKRKRVFFHHPCSSLMSGIWIKWLEFLEPFWTLRIEVSAKNSRAERKAPCPQGYWNIKTIHKKQIKIIWCPKEGKPSAGQKQPMKALGMRQNFGETGKIWLGRNEKQDYKKQQGAGNENTAQVEDWEETSLNGDRGRVFLVESTGNQLLS